MTGLEYLGRTLADSKDRASWLALHDTVIGASTAAKFAKRESVEKYVRSMLAPSTFTGNAATESGNRWEPLLLAWAGLEPNSMFIHMPREKRFAATPDGSKQTPDGLVLGEIKAKHNKVVTGPTPAEVRQVAWQLLCIPEAVAVEFVWGEIVLKDNGAWDLRRDPQTLVFTRESPQIVAVLSQVVEIAHDVIRGVEAARALAKEVAF